MQVIVLNADYSYLNTIDWRRAVKLMVLDKVEVLKESEREIRNYLRDVVIRIPLVVKLIKLVRKIYRNKIPFTKKNIYIRDGYTCQYCGSQRELSIDHVVPISRGGKTNYENCVTACRKCNCRKNNRLPSECNMFLKKKPIEPTIMEFLRIKMKAIGADRYLRELGVF